MKNTGFTKVTGGYEKRTSETTRIFIPDMCAKSFDEATGTVEMYTPKYEEKEPAKPSKVGMNAYQYETQEAPEDCDFELTIGHYGDNYLTPLKEGLTLKGRGIKWLDRWYRVTDLALEKLEKQYKIKYEMMFD